LAGQPQGVPALTAAEVNRPSGRKIADQGNQILVGLGDEQLLGACAYLDPQARRDEPLHWHDALDRTLARLHDWDRRGCADGSHRPDCPPPDDTDHSHRERTVYADLTARETERASVATNHEEKP
jgi:hypothetical protein